MKDTSLCKYCEYGLRVKSKSVAYFCQNPYYRLAVHELEERCKFYVRKKEENNRNAESVDC